MLQYVRDFFKCNVDPNIPDCNCPKNTKYLHQLSIIAKLATALYPVETPGFWVKLLYIVFITITDLLVVVTGFQFLFSSIYRFNGNLNEIMDIAINVPFYLFGAFFILYYQYKRVSLKMMFQFAYDNFRYRSARGLTVFTMAPLLRVHHIFIPYFVVFTFVGAYQWFVGATFSTIKGVWQLPLEIDYPMDSHASPFFEILFGLQVYIQAIMCFNYSNMVASFIIFSNLVIAQFDVLRCSIKNTGYTALLRLGVPHAALSGIPDFTSCVDSYYCGSEQEVDCCYDQIENNEIHIKQISENAEYCKQLDQKLIDKKIIEAISDCIEHHKVIRTFCKHMEDLFTIPLGFYVIEIWMIVAFTLYSNADHYELKSLTYLSMSIFASLTICYIGNQVFLQSEMLDLAVYWSGWEHQSARVRKYYLILMMQSARPVQLTGGGLVRLTLDSFIAIMKMSFSFNTLMLNRKQ